MNDIYLIIALSPLVGAIIAGLFGARIGRTASHWVTILSVGLSAALSLYVLKMFIFDGLETYNASLFTWMDVGKFHFEIGFLVDHLTAVMMSVVTFVSLMVHIYTIGYMADDPGYQRFFSYIALFTFSMLMLVMANNFLQLFFGWEAVGLVSYLLIGFWFKRPTAIFANLKAFLVNRVGDFGFLLGISAIFMHFGSLDYVTVFEMVPQKVGVQIELFAGVPWSLITVICILLFIGAMGKSAQAPLHVWLPDSMEGPTPISALIHAATMVTAGIFMVARMSPLFEYSPTALSFVLIIGAVTALFMGLIGIVQNDIKRVVAYSTLSQLGYMTVALGASAYSAAIFHLLTHAFFKALLFLGAGSVIIALHHQQDMRHMGGVGKYMKYTFISMWIGTLALVGTPGFSGFFSKDLIIEAVKHSDRTGATFAYVSVLLGVVITALYSFRLIYLVFHGEERMDAETRAHAHESPWVVTGPLMILAVPSVVLGWIIIEPLIFGGFLSDAIFVLPANDVLGEIGKNFHGAFYFVLHGFKGPAVWLALSGFGLATFLYYYRPDYAGVVRQKLRPLHWVLEKKYGFDEFNQLVFARGSVKIGKLFWRGGDVALIDGLLVNGSARLMAWLGAMVRHVQTGYLYHYAFVMVASLAGLIWWIVL